MKQFNIVVWIEIWVYFKAWEIARKDAKTQKIMKGKDLILQKRSDKEVKKIELIK